MKSILLRVSIVLALALVALATIWGLLELGGRTGPTQAQGNSAVVFDGGPGEKGAPGWGRLHSTARSNAIAPQRGSGVGSDSHHGLPPVATQQAPASRPGS